MKHYYLDSSGDESSSTKEKNLKNSIFNPKGYTKGLIEHFHINEVNSLNTFKLQLGLLLHFFADRIARSEPLNATYQSLKADYLSLSEEDYSKIITELRETLTAQFDKFIIVRDYNDLSDKDYVQLFNWLFNPNIALPDSFRLKDVNDETKVKEDLLSILYESEIDFSFLCEFGLKVTIDKVNDASSFLAATKLFNRSNKNKIKYLKIQNNKAYPDSNHLTLKNANTPSFNDHTTISTNNKNVTFKIAGLGTYDQILKTVPLERNAREAFIDHIYDTIKGKKFTRKDLKSKEEVFKIESAENFIHLLLVETQRDNSTILQAPMFLDLIKQDQKYLDKKYFPMALKQTVKFIRGINNDYNKDLPNNFTYDYDNHNTLQPEPFLIAVGDLIIEWSNNFCTGYNLESIGRTFALITFIDGLIYSEKDDLSLRDLDKLISDLEPYGYDKDGFLEPLKEKLSILKEMPEATKYYYLGQEDAIKRAAKASNKFKIFYQEVFDEFADNREKLQNLRQNLKFSTDKLLEDSLKDILNTLIVKFNEWYNIDIAPYINLDSLNVDEGSFITATEGLKKFMQEEEESPRPTKKAKTEKGGGMSPVKTRVPFDEVTNKCKAEAGYHSPEKLFKETTVSDTFDLSTQSNMILGYTDYNSHSYLGKDSEYQGDSSIYY
jgi:hypothetical protein